MTLLTILQLILGEAEQIVPMFIHNPKSQQIEGIIVGTANGLVQGLTPSVPTKT